MILVGLAFAGELSLTSSMAVGVDAELQLEITDGRARLAVINTGAGPMVVDWSRSWITPIEGPMSELVPGGADRPEPDVLVAPVEIAASERITVRPVPRGWLTDGPDNDAEQWASWARPGEVTIELVVMNDEGEGTLKATWAHLPSSTAPAPSGAPLAIPAGPDPSGPRPPAVVPKPLPDPALVQRRLEWDQRYYRYRRQERTARVLWVTGATVGALGAAFAGITAAQIPGATDDPIDAEEPTRTELIESTRVYGVLAGVGVLVALPTFAWDFSVRKRRRQLGPRP